MALVVKNIDQPKHRTYPKIVENAAVILRNWWTDSDCVRSHLDLYRIPEQTDSQLQISNETIYKKIDAVKSLIEAL